MSRKHISDFPVPPVFRRHVPYLRAESIIKYMVG
nr:MAG TPA: hypothetical protein [Caudoviricetes sp.]